MLHNSLLVMNRLNLTGSAFFMFWGYSLLQKDLTIQKLRYSFIPLNMLFLSPWVWERVRSPIIIFLDSLTFENAVLFIPRDY